MADEVQNGEREPGPCLETRPRAKGCVRSGDLAGGLTSLVESGQPASQPFLLHIRQNCPAQLPAFLHSLSAGSHSLVCEFCPSVRCCQNSTDKALSHHFMGAALAVNTAHLLAHPPGDAIAAFCEGRIISLTSCGTSLL